MISKSVFVVLAIVAVQISAKVTDPEQEILKREAKEAKRYNKYLAGKLLLSGVVWELTLTP